MGRSNYDRERSYFVDGGMVIQEGIRRYLDGGKQL